MPLNRKYKRRAYTKPARSRVEWWRRALPYIRDILREAGIRPPRRTLLRAVRIPSSRECDGFTVEDLPLLPVKITCGPIKSLEVILHELIHLILASTHPNVIHSGPFVIMARACGIIPPWSIGYSSPELRSRLSFIASQLGPYPAKAQNGKR